MNKCYDKNSEHYRRKLSIAKFCYKQIMQVMNDLQEQYDYELGFCWDGCIQVDDILFQENEMITDEE